MAKKANNARFVLQPRNEHVEVHPVDPSTDSVRCRLTISATFCAIIPLAPIGGLPLEGFWTVDWSLGLASAIARKYRRAGPPIKTRLIGLRRFCQEGG